MGENIVFKKMKRGDVFAVFIVFSIAVLLFFTPLSHSGGNMVMIKTESVTYRYPINEDRQLTLNENGISLTVVIENGFVYVKESTCKDKICMHGKLHGGGCIVCLPAKTIVQIETGGADAVAG